MQCTLCSELARSVALMAGIFLAKKHPGAKVLVLKFAVAPGEDSHKMAQGRMSALVRSRR